jgi:Xaa-Pro aminopeptidase
MAPRKPLENMRTFTERRKMLADKMPAGSALIVASAPEHIRNDDVHHTYRQDTNFYYLTGFEEPGALFVFLPGLDGKEPTTHLFVQPKDVVMETWTGFRFGPELAQSEFNMERAYTSEKFIETVVPLLEKANVERLYYRNFKNLEIDQQLDQVLQKLKSKQGRSGFGMVSLYDADELIGELRVVKNDLDLLNHRRACVISSEAHIELMKKTKPGVNERELHGQFIFEIMKRGAAREGYGSIVAGGPGACTLHYVFNDQFLRSGDLLLVDAGGEYNYYTGDITRTYPVNGKFTREQTEVYQLVLDIQKALIQSVKPGVPFVEFHKAGARLLSQAMLDLGLLSGRLDDVIESGEYKKYYPHGIGHYLGMDVHDEGRYKHRNGDPRKIETGMVFTIEPGLYIPPNNKNVPEKFRGIGIRIEDNILVTETGFENLTGDCPKEISDLEKIVGRG